MMHACKHLRRLAMAAAILTVLVFTLPALAQNRDNDTTRGELVRFDQFLDSHPGIAADLRANPSLVNNQRYVNAHPELKNFLGLHPGVREEIKENPGRFVRQEQNMERRGGDITRGEVANFDQFLDRHPAVARDLNRNPRLIDSPDYVSKHPELKEFMRTHPNAANEFREHPQKFMKRERQFDKNEQRKEERQEERREERNEARLRR